MMVVSSRLSPSQGKRNLAVVRHAIMTSTALPDRTESPLDELVVTAAGPAADT